MDRTELVEIKHRLDGVILGLKVLNAGLGCIGLMLIIIIVLLLKSTGIVTTSW